MARRILTALALSVLSFPALAQIESAGPEGFYVGADVGWIHYDDNLIDDDGSYSAIVAGYEFLDGLLSADLAYGSTSTLGTSYEIVDPTAPVSLTRVEGDADVTSARLLAHLPLSGGRGLASVFAGVGYHQFDASATATFVDDQGQSFSVSADDDESGTSLVVGGEGTLGESMVLRAMAERFDLDDAGAWTLSVGLAYRF